MLPILPLGCVCLSLFFFFFSYVNIDNRHRNKYPYGILHSPTFKSMDFHFGNAHKKEEPAIRQVKKNRKRKTRDKQKPNSNINKWIRWRETTYLLKKCKIERERERAEKYPSRYELVALYIAAKFVEKVSFYLNSMNERREKKTSEQTRYTNSNPANCTNSNCICTRMNHSTSERTRHSIFFCLQFLLCL